jgi:hypothetical protein
MLGFVTCLRIVNLTVDLLYKKSVWVCVCVCEWVISNGLWCHVSDFPFVAVFVASCFPEWGCKLFVHRSYLTLACGRLLGSRDTTGGVVAVREEILQRKWRWLWHTFRNTTASVRRHAITWSPQGKRRGRPKITRQQSVESEMREICLWWGQLEWLAQDRDA